MSGSYGNGPTTVLDHFRMKFRLLAHHSNMRPELVVLNCFAQGVLLHCSTVAPASPEAEPPRRTAADQDIRQRPSVDMVAGRAVNSGMKYAAPRPFADAAVAARKLLEIANATEAVQEGRIFIETINGQFLFKEGGTPEEYRAGLACAVTKGWLWKHESGTHVKFTPVGAEMFA
jgi:hypothetical protein